MPDYVELLQTMKRAAVEAVAAGQIAPSRHKSYIRLYEQAKEIPEWETRKN